MKGELHLAKPPFEIKEKPTTQAQEEKKTSALIHQANWVIPEDPSHVLYRSQTIIVLAGAIFPWLSNILEIFDNLNPIPSLYFTSISMTIAMPPKLHQ